jgi:CubicO group peptidase (beta-lactamase class C family)
VRRLAATVLGAIAFAVAPLHIENAHAQPVTNAPSDIDVSAFVDSYMRARMARDHVAGGVVAIVREDRTVLLRGYGAANDAKGEAVDPARTLFRIGSISKTFTWLSILKMAERGELRLEEDVNTYLPPAARIRYDRFKGPVTIRDLMAHAGGFDDDESYLFAVTPERVLSLEDYLSAHREALVRAPRTFSSYSNYGAALAGLAAQRRAGAKNFPTFMEREILTPFGLHSTTFREFYPSRTGLPAPMPEGSFRSASIGYSWSDAGFVPRRPEFITGGAPAGSAYSTGADMARYMRILLGEGVIDGSRLYGAYVAQKLHEPILVGPSATNGWRHGFLSLRYPGGREVIGHNGATLFFRSNMILIPSLRLGVFVAANTDTADDLVEELPAELVKTFYPTQDQQLAPVPVGRDLSEFTGVFRVSRRAHAGMARFIRLLQSEVTIKDNGGGDLLVDFGETRRFFDQGSDWFPAADVREHGEESLLFLRDARGRVQRVVPSHNALALERAPWWETTPVLFSALGLHLTFTLGTTGMLLVRRRPRGNCLQLMAHRSVAIAGGVLMVGVASFLVWVAKTEDPTYLIAHWPGIWLSAAHWLWRIGLVLSFVAVGLAAAATLLSPLEGAWNRIQRAALCLAATSVAGFATVLLAWGALG